MTKLKKFEASTYLTDEETIKSFLTACQEDDDPEMHARAAQRIDAARCPVFGHLSTAQHVQNIPFPPIHRIGHQILRCSRPFERDLQLLADYARPQYTNGTNNSGGVGVRL